jgi:hypothetical protein
MPQIYTKSSALGATEVVREVRATILYIGCHNIINLKIVFLEGGIMKSAMIPALAILVLLLQACVTEGPRNEAIAEYREPEVVCEMQAPTGSRIKKRVCYPSGGPTGLERDRTFGRLHDLPMDKDEL